MKFIAALFALITLASPARAVGFQQVSVPDPGYAPLEVGIWYPSDAGRVSRRSRCFGKRWRRTARPRATVCRL